MQGTVFASVSASVAALAADGFGVAAAVAAASSAAPGKRRRISTEKRATKTREARKRMGRTSNETVSH